MDCLFKVNKLERIEQAAGVDVMGGLISSEEHDRIRGELWDAQGDLYAAKECAGELLAFLLRMAAADGATRSAVVKAMLTLIAPELAPVADRMDDFAARLTELQLLVKRLVELLEQKGVLP